MALFGGQREADRDVQKTYSDYGDEYFGALGDFLESKIQSYP